MENKKRGKGLIIFLIILVLLLGTCLTLLLTGIVKNPFVKEAKCKVETETTKTTTKTETKEEKKEETRYYQFVSPYSQEKSMDGTPIKSTIEIELDADGTAKIDYHAISDSDPKEGIYVENDKYIILELNNTREQCTDDNYQADIADVCTDNMILIKDGDVLKTQRGALLHFEIDNANNSTEFLKVKKTDLLTDLKN